MRFFELSPADAERYRAQVAADGPARLAELTRLLNADGIDLNQFDGTIPSLKPLWIWYMTFAQANFPGIAANATPRTEAVEPVGAEYSRKRYAAELIAHYMFEVAKKCFLDVEWVTNPHVGMDSFQRTAVQYRDEDHRGLAHLDRFTASATSAFLQGRPDLADPEYLPEAFVDGAFVCSVTTAERCLALPHGASILAPMLGVPEAPRTDELTFEVDPGRIEAPTPGSDGEVGDELLLAHPAAIIEELELAPPIDLAAVTAALAGLDFRDLDGASPTAQTILAEEFAEFVCGDDAVVSTLVTGGKLRSLQVSSISPSAAAWHEIVDALTTLADKIGAKLAREDEFESNDQGL